MTLDEMIFNYQRLILKIDSALDGEDINIVVPAVACFLAASGACSGKDKKEFIAWVVEKIDEAYNARGLA